MASRKVTKATFRTITELKVDPKLRSLVQKHKALQSKAAAGRAIAMRWAELAGYKGDKKALINYAARAYSRLTQKFDELGAARRLIDNLNKKAKTNIQMRLNFNRENGLSVEGVLREFIASALSYSSRNRTSIPSPLRQAQDVDMIRPTAGGNVLTDEENETSAQKVKQAACILIISDDGKVLAVSRKDDPSMMGMPGGSVDPGESPIQAAKRELKEETGLDVTDLNPVFSKFDGDSYCTTFVGKVEGEINTDESGIIRWVYPSVLVDEQSSPFVSYNIALFKKLGII